MIVLYCWCHGAFSLLWRHNGRGSASNHQHHDCLLNRLFRRRSKKTSKLRVTGLCAGNSPGTGEFPAQMSSNAENVSIWWCHLIKMWFRTVWKWRACFAVSLINYNNVIMGAMAFQITSLTIVYSTIYSGGDQRSHQSPMSLALCGEFTGDPCIPRTNGQ